MKISIAYRPDDKREAVLVDRIMQLLKPFFRGGTMKYSKRHEPYNHIYLATKSK